MIVQNVLESNGLDNKIRHNLGVTLYNYRTYTVTVLPIHCSLIKAIK